MNILVLCTGNSARSIMLECILNSASSDITAFSAGSTPTGAVNPFALKKLEEKGHDLSGLRSKSWDVFAMSNAPKMDLVITVCGNAASETCPFWPGAPLSAHWGIDDPAAVVGDEGEIARAFDIAYAKLKIRADALLKCDLQSMEKDALKAELDRIGLLA